MMKWIKVKDALPDYGKKVLLCVVSFREKRLMSGNTRHQFAQIGKRTHTSGDGEHFDVPEGCYVTHWAEVKLPKATLTNQHVLSGQEII